MNKLYLTACALLFSNAALAEIKELTGEWEPFSRSSSAITGFVKIDESRVSWGVAIEYPKNSDGSYYPCSADYEYFFTPEKKEHKIIFREKKCDYENMKNSDLNKSLSGWVIKFREDTKYEPEAWFSDLEDDGSISGSGVLIHVNGGKR